MIVVSWLYGGRARVLAASLLALLAATPVPTLAQDDSECGPMSPEFSYEGTHYGPFDYTNVADRRSHLPVVERYHFTRKVQTLQGGQNTSTPGGDLQYTLKAFPNHHIALDVLIRLALKEKRQQPVGMDYTVDCWFDRAMRWRPSDAMVHVLAGIWLMRTQRVDQAIAEFRVAEDAGLRDVNLYYNAGLAYLEKRDYPKALAYAHQAYAAGAALPALRDKLKQAGAWREPDPAAATQ